MFNFKPKDNLFFELFTEGAQITHNSAKELRKLMDSLSNPDETLEAISKLENVGDTVTHRLIEYTKKMFITPLDREDIFNISKEIDNVTDNIDSAAHRFIMYNVQAPTEEAIKIIDKLVAATEDLVAIISQLKTLNKNDDMLEKIIEINTLENESDVLYRDAITKLFKDPEDLLYVIKWKDLYKYLEDSVDCCEKLANEIRGVVMKYA
ncbi:DUF47 domain-containing protein [Clostridium oryzae]|uniref:Putative pit accessory protein n=1 Tax=Clostridium oryzae TaxID=1450648 RepID=A0A1V4IBM1_9CLOT|nr:DUF47 family protein [Clostridium oryzae]OPJ57323.1 putative pit accessory protein [Clostridium oryzae]